MGEQELLIGSISDTAHWAAIYRARENDRQDALFRDSFARRLSGPRGEQIAKTLPSGDSTSWAWVTRTYLFDRLISEQIAQGVDMVVNLAAGLDTRPYRMELPSSLQWVEVDLPKVLSYKEDILGDETPRCHLDRIPVDLSSPDARREMVGKLGGRASKVLIVTEGLLVYKTAAEVGALAEDLARPASFQRWVLELLSPGLLRMLQRRWNQQLGQGGASLQFAPEEGPGFFIRHGWQPAEVHSSLKTAARLKRLPLWMRLLAFLPESTDVQGPRPWSGVCLMERR